jgi:small subunit ribosomal protein S17
MENEVRNSRRTRIGIVTSDKMDKTIVVSVMNRVKHPIYGKYINRTKKYKAHDEEMQAHIGDTVEIMETRKLSKEVYHRLVRIIERAK